MLDPVRAKARLIGFTALSFVGGVLLASGLEWTAGSHASTLLQDAPNAPEIRPVAELSESFITIAESVTPAVVSIRTERQARRASGGQTPENLPEPFRRFFENQPDQPAPQGGGTGFLISADGYIVTNNHVVADADVINVVTMDRREFTAELVGRDPTTDIAVIRVDRDDPHTLVAEIVERIGEVFPLVAVQRGSEPASRFRYRDGGGTVGEQHAGGDRHPVGRQLGQGAQELDRLHDAWRRGDDEILPILRGTGLGLLGLRPVPIVGRDAERTAASVPSVPFDPSDPSMPLTPLGPLAPLTPLMPFLPAGPVSPFTPLAPPLRMNLRVFLLRLNG